MATHPAFKSDTAATPDYTTMLESVHPGGVAWGVKRGEVWLYRTLPLHPVSDLKSSDGLHTAAAALASAFDGLAAVSKNQMNKRSMSKDGYRSWQLLITNVPRLYRPPAASPLYGLLTEHMGGRVVPRRQVLFGVRLESDYGFRGARSITDYARAAIENLTAEPTLERYETDRIRIAGILDRAGMTVPTGDEFARADSWWNLERHNLTPFLPHSDHLHVFDSTRALQMAEQAGYDNCRDWTPQTVPGCIDLTFATLAEMEVDGVDVTSQQALWLQDLLAMNALAVSVRGKVEPMKVTRDVIRSQIRKWENDEIEKAKVGKRSRAEQFDIVQETKALEELYASKDSPATLYDTSVIVALDGQGIDLEAASANSLFRLAVMEARQAPAFLETMLCSTSAQNPRRHQWPVHTLAYAGAAGLSQAGDTDEPRALLGFTEHDRQPVGVSPIASSRADAAPLFAVSGATGSGKQLRLSTPVPTPTGWTTMGQLRTGDEVLWRGGGVCRVTGLSPIDNAPRLFRVRTSDGQQMIADGDHQWIASDFNDRNRHNRENRKAAIERHRRLHALADAIDHMADAAGADEWWSVDKVFDRVADLPGVEWKSPASVREVLEFMDTPRRRTGHQSTFRRRQFTTAQKTHLYDSCELVDVLIASLDTANVAARWPGSLTKLQAVTRVRELVIAGELPTEMTARDVVEHMHKFGAPAPHKNDWDRVSKIANRNGLSRRCVVRDFEQGSPDPVTAVHEVVEYHAGSALRSLAGRIRQRHPHAPSGSYDEQVVTTDEMIAAGVAVGKDGRRNWSIRVADKVAFPAQDLPVDPYLFGAWLGDGNTRDSGITVGPEDYDFMAHELTQAWGSDPNRCVTQPNGSRMLFFGRPNPELCKHGHDLGRWVSDATGRSVCKGCGNKTATKFGANSSLGEKLVDLNVLHNKHIPMLYLRSSAEQRLAVLQGLMDTDGTCAPDGNCELSLSDPRLAADALELIRSLGIKASVTVSKGSYKDADGTEVVCRDRHRIHFTTTTQVFRLPRKACRVPVEVSEVNHWLYIESIEPVLPGDADYEPARCITVDSPDASYLIEGFVPTHNTMLLQWLAAQFAETPTSRGEMTPVVVINPKAGSDLSGVVEWVRQRTGQGQVANLDDLLSADGVFDPIRFSRNQEVGLELALDAILSMNPFGPNRLLYELPLTNALRVGISAGGTCIGEALELAVAHGADAEMVRQVLTLTDSIPKARAIIGRRPGGSSLSVAGGITLIQVGDTELNLAEGNSDPSLAQRVDMTLLRLMVQGSAAALAHRDGVVMFDEAWVFAKGAGDAIQALGRTAREMRVMMMMFNQRPSELLTAGMENYVSRSIIMALPPAEAEAACQIAGLEPAPDRVRRLAAESGWNSMRAIISDDRRVLRGTVGTYVGLDGRPVNVEVTIPPAFFKVASTNAAEKGDRPLTV